MEEWKLLISAALAGLARESLKLAAAYACERKQFGQLIGTFQGISHPLADLLCDVDGGKFLVWKSIRDIADNSAEAGATISLATWWNVDAATRSVAQALHTFGGYGLTTEYDIFLYNLRAKAWPLVFGDPQRFLEEAGRRFYAGETASAARGRRCADRLRPRRRRPRNHPGDRRVLRKDTSRPRCARSSTTRGKASCPSSTRSSPMRSCSTSACPGMWADAVFRPMPRSPRWMPSSIRATTTRRPMSRRWSR